MPLQGLVTAEAIRRTHKYAGKGECQKVAFNPVGQVVGQINEVESCRDLIFRLMNEYVEALDRVNALMPE
jgi:NAD(P)H-dependent flavin oxidoreductase YrpB (nitropropane dioxygenase family)